MPRRFGVANRHIIPLLFLFFLISMADVLTTAKFLSLGGGEGNQVVKYLLHLYGPTILVPYKLAVLGAVAGVIGLFWGLLGVEPRRFFWILTVMTLVTVSIVLSNIAYICSLL